MGISKIAGHAHSLGLGERSGIDLPGERSGLIPTPEWKQQVRGARWFAGETISVSIGQGAVTITPLQLLRATSAIASGLLTTPHVFFRADRLTPEMNLGSMSRQLDIPLAASNRIRQGMWGSVNSWGTGHNAAIPGLDICGKTGTVQVIGNEKKKELQKESPQFEDHSWFVGFATRDTPEIAVVVFLEHGGQGGIAAAPLAREIFRAYFEKKQQLHAGTPAYPLIAEARR
jgi:penicillin-binding protein 2